METKSPYRVTPQLVLGLIILTLGVLFTLHNMDLINAREYIRYWPVLLMIFGVSKLLQPKGTSGRMAGVIFTLVGAAMLADRLYLFEFRVWDFWPVIFVIIGGSVIWRAMARRQVPTHGRFGIESSSDSNDTVNGFAFLGGVRRTNNSQDFKGGELTAIMGGCEIDLREASIKSGVAVIDMFAFWGGIEIKVPADWSVALNGTPLMGGFDDKTRPPQGGSSKRLEVKGYAIMGGVEISN
ncbi:MAG TPA: DUF5668 domain-containing protein [Bacteroidota bacterium]|nr:DUF5668 domain-containing protein [Bacteroidota bacterium]